MNINIKSYLSEEEIKAIVKEEIKSCVRNALQGVGTTNHTFVTRLAKSLAKEEVQELIPNFKELINEHIQEQIKSIKLSDFFVSSFGWSNPGNKILNSVLTENKPLLDAKIKEVFKIVDK